MVDSCLNLIGPYSVENPQTIHDEPYFDKPNEDFDLTLVGNIHPKVGSLPLQVHHINIL